MAQHKASSSLQRLVALARALGDPNSRQTILAEGNISVDQGDGTFYVKASGAEMAKINADGFTRVRTSVIINALVSADMSDSMVREVLMTSRVHPIAKIPSIETFLHAICLHYGKAKWVGHTHSLSVVRILCSKAGAIPFSRHVFPDSIVVCGRHLAVVPYADPGIHLAIQLNKSLRNFIKRHGVAPKAVLMENHGPVALGQSDREVMNILTMLEKWASVLLGTYPVGGPRFLHDRVSDRIETRPDEQYRRKELGYGVSIGSVEGKRK